MRYFEEPVKRIPVAGEYDVLVIGAGPGGIAAALSAARMGVKTCLVEQGGDVGGISTSGMMSHWTGSVRSRLYTEILELSAARNADAGKIVNTIDPEQLKTLYLELLSDAGCEVRLYTFACGVSVVGGAVTGVVTESKSGRAFLAARVVVDGSGDGDIAAKAGVPFQLGREGDHLMQPATVMFKVGGVDLSRAVFPGSFETTVETGKGELQALARKHLPSPAGHVLLYRSTLPGVVTCNMTNSTGIDGTDAASLTAATVTCRRQMNAIVAFLREFAPGYENCYLLSSASLVGIRETRHFKGLYTLTAADILEAREFDDAVVFDAHFNFDVHNLTGAGLDQTGAQKKFPQKLGYTIPYRCLIPETLDGLLLCGRNISGTHMAHSNFRVMPICVGIGAAAGTAAALAAKRGISPRAVPAADIQKML